VNGANSEDNLPPQATQADIPDRATESPKDEGFDRDQAEQRQIPVAKEQEVLSERWEIIEPLGQGGMAAVYKARHRILNKFVAVKFLLPHLASNPIVLRRFQQEGLAASRLNHQNVITVHDCGVTDDGRVYLIMDYLEGKSLSEVLDENGPLSGSGAVDLLIDIAKGLQHAHAHGILHRDLKPSNVMFAKGADGVEQAKIVDFGIAKVVQDDGGQGIQHLTKTGECFGSPLYMSPEQCLGQPVDARSDIYSFGCMMYELLTGAPPLIGNNSLETMQMHVNHDAMPIVSSQAADSTLKRLDIVIKKALAKKPQDRYQNVAELLTDLELVKEAPDSVWAKKSRESLNRAKKREKPAQIPWRVLVPLVVVLWYSIVPYSMWTQRPKGYLTPASYQYSFWVELPKKTESASETGLHQTALHVVHGRADGLDPIEVVNELSDEAGYQEKSALWSDAQKNYIKALELRRKLGTIKSLSYAQDLEGLANCLAAQGNLVQAAHNYDQAAAIYDNFSDDAQRRAGFKARLVGEAAKSQAAGKTSARDNDLKAQDCIDLLKSASGDCDDLVFFLDQDKEYCNEHPSIREKLECEKADLLRRLCVFGADKPDDAAQSYTSALKQFEERVRDVHSRAKCHFGLALVNCQQNQMEEATRNLEDSYKLFLQSPEEKEHPSDLFQKEKNAYLEALWQTNPIKAIFQGTSK
jgi:serine/threonine protein kinase